VLRPELYDAVMSGDRVIPSGTSIPGGGPAQSAPSEHHHHPG
jgi:hypothetical protein